MADDTAYCPECEAPLRGQFDLDVSEIESDPRLLAASKRYYVVNCASCDATIGGSVAAAN